MNWYLAVLKKYAVFGGRARRMEYWMFFLFNFIISFAIGFLESIIGSPMILSTIYSLAVFVPGLAVTVRRLHDTGKSGWWILIAFVPFVGWLILLIFMFIDGTPGANQYGENQKGLVAPEAV
jgi:uncharacterized membrane protein YhaH (DUF805 family)